VVQNGGILSQKIEFIESGQKALRPQPAMISQQQALFVAWYNFARTNEALKGQTPAMASQLTDDVWTIKELIERAAC
jgi:hypothetical protein